MNSHEYIPLNSWLSNADMLYIDGRLLWFQISGISGACILLWLSIEQVMKTLIFQKRIKEGRYSSTDSKSTFKQFNSWGQELGHDLKGIRTEFEKCFPELISQVDEQAIGKVYEFFNRRYVVNTSSGIALDLIHKVDSVYFKFRDQISEDLPIAFLDEIADRKSKSKPQPLAAYEYAFTDNPYFRARKNFRT